MWAEIEAMLAEQQEINIRDLFLRSRSKRELIVTFLAFLELVKAMKIRLIQRELFGEIYARRKEPETLPLPEPPTSSQEGPDPL
jgi:chromatin segregation and condensation protein Rec8/ScpA/Scc1 (kleisin family)